MIERKIKLSDTEEVKDFVNAAGKCDFEIDVCYSRAVIDAKSLLGMLYLGVARNLRSSMAKRMHVLNRLLENMQ